MKFSKLLLFAASALVMGTACSDDDPIDPQPKEDVIEITPATATVSSKGGKVSTMVTSSGTWTLSAEDNAFVLPSVTEGEDGAVVDFTVQPNDKEEDRTFTYKFTCGEKSADFKITLTKKASQKEEQLELIYTEGSNVIPCEGGLVKVLVTSSGEWTLEGSYGFVHPSATSGEDGAEVVFEVDPNEEYENKTADYLFTMGDKKVAFQIVVEAAIPEYIEIVPSAEMRVAYTEEKRLAVGLKTDVDARDLAVEIVSETEGWLAYTIARPAEGDGEANVTAYFTLAKNDGETAREATVTFKGTKTGEATLKLVQLYQPSIEPAEPNYYLSVESQSITVPVTANVEFDVTLGEESNGWLTYDGFSNGEMTFTVTALAEGEAARSCVVTLTEKNGPENAEPYKAEVLITQKPKGLIETVVDMRNARMYFYAPFFTAPKLNLDPLNNLSSGTIEALVNIQDKRPDGSLSTILGVEGKFLLRLGDAALPWNQIQLATSNGNFTSTNMKLTELNHWYHIAVTWGNGYVNFYIDGKIVYSTSFYATANFGSYYNNDGENYGRVFWIGYSYIASRYFPGYMSEVRIWNRALTESEINATNHFYQVDPASEGLVSYWKLDGESTVAGDKTWYIHDYSVNNNTLMGEVDVKTVGNQQQGTFGVNWVKTSLP